MPDQRFWSGRRVLVTGHSGFKGGWLALWLASMGAEVVGFSNSLPSQPCLFDVAHVSRDVTSVEGDVRDLDEVVRVVREYAPDIVFHLAAQALVRGSYEDPIGTYATNLMGTVHMLEAVRRTSSIRVLVNVTTDKCYENREWEWGYREIDTLGGRDPYSSSKACAELVTAAYRSSFFSSDDSAAVATARAGNVIGGGDWGADRIIPDLMRGAIEGVPVRVRNPDAVRPWQHVLNPLSGYLVLAEHLWHAREIAGAWNFGPGEIDSRSVTWIVERIADRWDDGLRWERDTDQHPHEANILKLDSTLARTRLAWTPAWDLDHAIAATVDWYAAYKAGEDMHRFSLEQIGTYQAANSDR